jgi:hypothetical protein
MLAQILHFPQPDPTPQPQPVPHPTAPPVPATPAALPLPMVHVAPVWTYRHVQRPLTELGQLSDAELNVLGAEGWELTGVSWRAGWYTFSSSAPRASRACGIAPARVASGVERARG